MDANRLSMESVLAHWLRTNSVSDHWRIARQLLDDFDVEFKSSPPPLDDDLLWDRAEAITAWLSENDYFCGHPEPGDVASTVRMLIKSGHIK